VGGTPEQDGLLAPFFEKLADGPNHVSTHSCTMEAKQLKSTPESGIWISARFTPVNLLFWNQRVAVRKARPMIAPFCILGKPRGSSQLSDNGQFNTQSNTRLRTSIPRIDLKHSFSFTYVGGWLVPKLHISKTMDIARPEFKQRKRRKQALIVAGIVLLVGILTAAVYRLKPAAPTVERGTVWTDTVKRGSMLRQVRGIGSLVPSQESVLQIPAETEANVVRIRMLPGSLVNVDTVLLDMSNPQVEQAAVDAQLQWKAAQAEYQSQRMKLESDLMNQKAGAATVKADYNQTQLQSQTDKSLYDLGVISGLAYKASKSKADELTIRNGLEDQRLESTQKSIDAQLSQLQAKMDQMRVLAELKQKQLNMLKVRAGIEGVLVELPLHVGQHVSPGTMLAKVVQPNHLMAELKVAETQARDVQIGEPASVDTHNGVIAGTVMRVDPAVQNGTVTVDVKLTGELPKGARPDLSVDGTIDLEKLDNVLYVGRPAFGQENSTISLFRLEGNGRDAARVPVKVGRASVNSIQVIEGLHEGDTVVLSDMSRWDNTDRIRLQD
jgi:multidrug resistance efflux pump